MIVQTAEGTSFDYPALAFSGLAVAPRQYSVAPPNTDFALPRLVDVQVPAGEDIDVNLIDADGTPVTLRYDADDGYLAISALLSSHAAHGSFNVDPALGARTEWLYSFPTRRAHPDNIPPGTIPPGIDFPTFAGDDSGCDQVVVSLLAEDGTSGGASETINLCGASGVARIAADASDAAPIVARDDDPVIETTLATGTATFDFSGVSGHDRVSWPDLDGNCLVGLPLWAMAITAIDNDNAQAGRIATFPIEDVSSREPRVVDCSGN